MREVVVVSGSRTAIGAFGGGLMKVPGTSGSFTSIGMRKKSRHRQKANSPKPSLESLFANLSRSQVVDSL